MDSRERGQAMPSPEKMARGRQLIQTLLPEIYFYDGEERPLNPLKRYSNWQTDFFDYTQMLRIARVVAQKGLRHTIQAAGWGGEAGSQFMVTGVYFHGGIDWGKIINTAVDRIYEREQERGISSEEISARTQGITTVEELTRVWEEEIKPRIPRSREEVRESVFKKWLNYIQKKAASTKQE